MAKGNSKGKPEKKQTKWTKIAVSLFLAATMIIVIFAYALNNGPITGPSTDRQLTILKGFNTLSDGLNLVPENASYSRYANLTSDQQMKSWMTQYFSKVMPPESVYSATIKRDMFTLYPKGSFNNITRPYVSLTDFGRGAVNVSYTQYTDGSNVMLGVNDLYFFTPQTDPIVSGMGEIVVPVLNTMKTMGNSSYDDYKDLFEKLQGSGLSEDGMTLEVVGKAPNANYSDRYYAAMGPMNDANKMYQIQAVLHTNRTLTNDEMDRLAIGPAYQKQKGFSSYNISYSGEYIIMDAKGPFDLCTEDLFYNWGFMKY